MYFALPRSRRNLLYAKVVRSPERWLRIVKVALEHGYTLPNDPDAQALEAFLAKQHREDLDRLLTAPLEQASRRDPKRQCRRRRQQPRPLGELQLDTSPRMGLQSLQGYPLGTQDVVQDQREPLHDRGSNKGVESVNHARIVGMPPLFAVPAPPVGRHRF